MILNIYQICLLIGFGFSFLYFFSPIYSEAQSKTHRAVFIVIVSTLLLEICWYILSSGGMNTLLLYNILFVYGRVLLLLFLFYNIPFSCGLEEKVSLAVFLFLLTGVLNSVFFQPIHEEVQTISYLFGNLLVLFFSVFFFKDILRQSKFKHSNLLSLPFFWIATFALFSAGESIIFTSFTSWFFPSQTNNLGFIQLFVRFLSGLMYLVFGLAFYAPLFFRKAYT